MSDEQPKEEQPAQPKEPFELSHLEAIRLISGMFQDDKEEMSGRLAICNLVARNALGLAENDFTDEQMLQCGIKLIREAK